jgi:hypothetical protein
MPFDDDDGLYVSVLRGFVIAEVENIHYNDEARNVKILPTRGATIKQIKKSLQGSYQLYTRPFFPSEQYLFDDYLKIDQMGIDYPPKLYA